MLPTHLEILDLQIVLDLQIIQVEAQDLQMLLVLQIIQVEVLALQIIQDLQIKLVIQQLNLQKKLRTNPETILTIIQQILLL